MNHSNEYDTIDEYWDYEQEYQEDIELIKSVDGISLGDLMGEDHDIWIKKNQKFGFDIEIDNDNGQRILKEEGIHPYAIESFALFCKRFLGSYANYCDKE